ncbi:hypothetical protein SAMN04488000_103252 [Lentzea albida]|uniref:Peptidase inhibitor family I36 n=2 Tax=Lentzea albida TaxID=65499 RepID=A0A1H9GS73_9PSEU|nr:hypothetical protein SAMN04488000_103252 [Lentzea albida]
MKIYLSIGGTLLRIVATFLAAFAALAVMSAPAQAGSSEMTSAAASSSDLCRPWGCYVSNTRFTGFYTVSNARPLCSASASGAGTVSCGRSETYSVTAGVSASVNVTFIKDSLSSTFGLNSSLAKSITTSSGCSHTFGPRGGRLWAVAEYSKYEFLVRNRQVGGGGANDAVVGRGWVGVPSGLKCYFRAY